MIKIHFPATKANPAYSSIESDEMAVITALCTKAKLANESITIMWGTELIPLVMLPDSLAEYYRMTSSKDINILIEVIVCRISVSVEQNASKLDEYVLVSSLDEKAEHDLYEVCAYEAN